VIRVTKKTIYVKGVEALSMGLHGLGRGIDQTVQLTSTARVVEHRISRIIHG
jgi:hypothetical protein